MKIVVLNQCISFLKKNKFLLQHLNFVEFHQQKLHCKLEQVVSESFERQRGHKWAVFKTRLGVQSLMLFAARSSTALTHAPTAGRSPGANPRECETLFSPTMSGAVRRFRETGRPNGKRGQAIRRRRGLRPCAGKVPDQAIPKAAREWSGWCAPDRGDGSGG